MGAADGGRRLSSRPTYRCAYCRKEFFRWTKYGQEPKYCSRGCYFTDPQGKGPAVSGKNTRGPRRPSGSSTYRQRAKRYGVSYDAAVTAPKVFARDRWTCQLCGVRTPRRLRGTNRAAAPELDHIVPMSVGGAHAWDNVQCACHRCNLTKRNLVRGQFRLDMQSPLEVS